MRTKQSIETLTPFLASVYAMLLLALEATGGQSRALPPPLWQRHDPGKHRRTSTDQALLDLRAEVWGEGLGLLNKYSFLNLDPRSIKSVQIENCAPSAVFYAPS